MHAIRSATEYVQALTGLEALMNARPGRPEEERLDLLGRMADAYEREHLPMEMPARLKR
jgi:antitoxin component HigA of HigAB toxin-antitoxin module